jgi:hypothetical protein
VGYPRAPPGRELAAPAGKSSAGNEKTFATPHGKPMHVPTSSAREVAPSMVPSMVIGSP